MLPHTPLFVLICVCALAVLPPAVSAPESWIGDPDAPVSADNPYLKLAETNVSRALSAEKSELFWLVWGSAAPESRRRENAVLRERALAATETLAAELKAKPSGHWNITIFLECVHLWQKTGAVPAERIAGWLAAARPSVEHNYEINRSAIAGEPEASWTTFAPNALFQSAAILTLAGRLYADEKYTAIAREIVRRTASHQLPGGAFSYIHDSGPAPVYYGFEITFLGRYYQLTRDPEAKRMLAAAAGYAHDALANGPFEAGSAPWWKHVWGTGGPIHGVEIAAGVAHDPVARALAQVRLKAGQPYWFSYVAMYFWDPTIPEVAPGADDVRLSGNSNGPLLRRGPWQVVMPFKPRNDTVVGATLSQPGKVYGYANYLESAALPVFLKSSADYRGRDTALFMVPSDELAQRSALVGDGWIAAGTLFHPRRGVYGEKEIPAAEGWQVAQVWFADANGLSGWLEAGASGQAVAGAPRGVLHFGAPLEPVAGQKHRYTSSGLELAFFGDQIDSVTTKEKEVSVHLKTQASGVDAYGVSLAHRGGPAVLVREPAAGGVLAVRIERPDTKPAWLWFNPTAVEVSLRLPAGGRLSRSESTAPAQAGTSLSLRPYETVLLRAD